jgi:hypothetical protein
MRLLLASSLLAALPLFAVSTITSCREYTPVTQKVIEEVAPSVETPESAPTVSPSGSSSPAGGRGSAPR